MNRGDEEPKADGAAVGPPRRGGPTAKSIRLVCWIGVVITILIGDLSGRPIIAFIGLASLILLLRTTPADAFKLRRLNSDVIILSIAILIMPWRWSATSIPLITATSLLWLRITRRSPWWTVIFAWNPAVTTGGLWAAGVVVIPALALTGLAKSGGLSIWLVCASLLVDIYWFRRMRIKSQLGKT